MCIHVHVHVEELSAIGLLIYTMYMYMYVHCVSYFPASKNVSDWWLAYWISHSHSDPGTPLNTTTLHSTPHTLHSTPLHYTDSLVLLDSSGSGDINATVLREASDNLVFYLCVYGGLAAANSVSASVHTCTLYTV